MGSTNSRNEYERLQNDVEDDDHEQQIGVGLSGGGVRSAAFCLGALQGLSKLPVPPVGNTLLDKVQVISTVSGGGYAGASLLSHLQRTDVDKTPFVLRAVLKNTKATMLQGIQGHKRVLLFTTVQMVLIIVVQAVLLAMLAFPTGMIARHRLYHCQAGIDPYGAFTSDNVCHSCKGLPTPPPPPSLLRNAHSRSRSTAFCTHTVHMLGLGIAHAQHCVHHRRSVGVLG
jgi:hypothetical protein